MEIAFPLVSTATSARPLDTLAYSLGKAISDERSGSLGKKLNDG